LLKVKNQQGFLFETENQKHGCCQLKFSVLTIPVDAFFPKVFLKMFKTC